MRAHVRIAILSSVVTLLIGGGATFAQQGSGLSPEELDNLTAEVAAELRCLVCRGQSVLESNSQLAQEMKVVIRDRLAGGETPEQVMAYFLRSYGDYILLKPRAEGVSLLVYLLPALALVGGGLLLFRLFKRWTRPAAVLVTPGPELETPPDSGVSAAPPSPDAGVPSGSHLSPEEQAWLQGRLQSK
jgi:cytochrome c-type biogenesis protein CcmH